MIVIGATIIRRTIILSCTNAVRLIAALLNTAIGDVLLLKAEALIMQDTPDLEAAAKIIDEVRERAGLGELSSSVRKDRDAMITALLNERRLELAFEGQRWFDLVRLDKVEEVMNAVYAKDSGRKSQVYAFDKNSYRASSLLLQAANMVKHPKKVSAIFLMFIIIVSFFFYLNTLSKDSGRKSQVYAFDKNSYRLPIPQSVIDANDKIEQNPGY